MSPVANQRAAPHLAGGSSSDYGLDENAHVSVVLFRSIALDADP